MLSEEEKEAIDYLQLCYDLFTVANVSLSKLDIVLNLIEKQSKEIQLLKEQKQYVIEEYGETIEKQSKEIEELKNSDLTTVYLNGFYDGEKKVQDKIKAKIEEIDKAYEDSKNEDGESEYYYPNYTVEVLQSLLEKE